MTVTKSPIVSIRCKCGCTHIIDAEVKADNGPFPWICLMCDRLLAGVKPEDQAAFDAL